ncbi:MAG: carbonic anhydrase [Bacteroidota bacterium]
MISNCADSCVVPELAFGIDLREIFVLQVIGNVINTSYNR